jgi:hypothetical protein
MVRGSSVQNGRREVPPPWGGYLTRRVGEKESSTVRRGGKDGTRVGRTGAGELVARARRGCDLFIALHPPRSRPAMACNERCRALLGLLSGGAMGASEIRLGSLDDSADSAAQFVASRSPLPRGVRSGLVPVRQAILASGGRQSPDVFGRAGDIRPRGRPPGLLALVMWTEVHYRGQ